MLMRLPLLLWLLTQCRTAHAHGACTRTPVRTAVRVGARVDPSHTRQAHPLPRTSPLLPLPAATLRLPCSRPLPGDCGQLGAWEDRTRATRARASGCRRTPERCRKCHARREERRLQLDRVPLRPPVLLLLPVHRAEPPQRRVQRRPRPRRRAPSRRSEHALPTGGGHCESRSSRARCARRARADGRAHALRGGAFLGGAAPGQAVEALVDCGPLFTPLRSPRSTPSALRLRATSPRRAYVGCGGSSSTPTRALSTWRAARGRSWRRPAGAARLGLGPGRG